MLFRSDIVKGIPFIESYRLQVPNVQSDKCVFRVNAWVGTVLLGYNLSPTFAVVLPPPPTPDPPVVEPPPPPSPPPVEPPVPAKEYPPSAFVSDNNSFINEAEDGTRWFYVDHDLPEVKSMVWQLSRIPFPCNPDLNWLEPPGMLAWGKIESSSPKFSVDFNAIMAKFKEKSGSPTLVHQGVKFETIPGVVLLQIGRAHV